MRIKRYYCPKCRKFKSRVSLISSDYGFALYDRYCGKEVIDVKDFLEKFIKDSIEQERQEKERINNL